MQFNSLNFMIFFPIVVAVYFVIPRKLRNCWLLLASYFFYMSWNALYALLIGASTVITYVSGMILESVRKDAADSDKSKKYGITTMVICIVINLAILSLFKYGNFFISNLNRVSSLFGSSFTLNKLNLVLPVGISFYTFQALGYIIDVYRGNVKAERNFVRYALFVSFFPQLVAGPIERSGRLLTQIDHVHELKLWNAERVTKGAMLMIWGLFMKMVIADRISIPVDMVFNDYRMYGSSELILAAFGFAIQIYCDFASYSTIAIGAAKVMGIDLMENFDTPYFARSIRDFWSRWHISLSTWFRDYLYIPLGGNRKGKGRKILNLMITFLVSGLWHGAGWNFVFWGGIHGLYHVIGDCLSPIRNKLVSTFKVKTDCFSYRFMQMVFNVVIVTFAWIFFRSDTYSSTHQSILSGSAASILENDRALSNSKTDP